MADSSKTKASTSAGGGGGADASLGHMYHRILAMIFILRLKLCRDNDPTFEYSIDLEKRDYGKFDDIVITYKIEGVWKELCIQCKHSSNKTTIGASDFLNGNKSNKFALKNYIESYKNIVENGDSKISERHFLLMNNRTTDINSNYSSFTITDDTFEQIRVCENVLSESVFKFTDNTIENTTLCKEVNGSNDIIDTKKFLHDFGFVPTKDTKDILIEINEILKNMCKNDGYEAKTLYNELYMFIDQNISQNGTISFEEISEICDPKSMYFRVRDPNHLFTGRKHQLEHMYSALQDKKSGFIIDIAVTGTSGIGKSQLTLEFIRKYKDKFKNVIWINAESRVSIENSFKDLAYSCKLIDAGETVTNMQLLVEKVYTHLSNRGQSLIIFDDATQFNTDKVTQGISKYLPENTLDGKLFFIVTSQNRKWKSKKSIDLEVFSERESCEFLSQTDISKLGTEKDLKLFCDKLGNLPIALQTGAAYILRQNEMCSMFGQPDYLVSNFIKEFKLKHKKLLNFENDESQKVLIEIWDKAMSTINKQKHGPLALLVLGIVCYFDSEGVPIKLLQGLREADIDDLYVAIKLLSDFSLLDIQDNKIFIHKLLQITFKEKITCHDEFRIKVIDSGFQIFLNSNPVEYDDVKPYIRIALQFFQSCSLENNTNHDRLEKLVTKLNRLCSSFGEKEQAIALCRNYLEIQRKQFKDTRLNTINSRILLLRNQIHGLYCNKNYLQDIKELSNDILSNNYELTYEYNLFFNEVKAISYHLTGKYKESKDIILECLKSKNYNPDKVNDYVALLQCLTNILKQCGLSILQEDEVTLIEKYWQLVSEKNTISNYGEGEKNLVLIYKLRKEYDLALNKLDNLIKKMIEMHGSYYYQTILCLLEKAALYIEIGNKDEALKLLNQARNDVEHMDENLNFLMLLSNISYQYFILEDYKNQESCAKLVIDFVSRNKDLELNYIYLQFLSTLTQCYKNQNLYNKALEIAKEEYKLRMSAPYGLENALTLKALYHLIQLQYIMENFEAIIQEVHNKYVQLKNIYKLEKELILHVLIRYGHSLINVGKLEEGISVFMDILPICIENEGMNGDNTKLTLKLIVRSIFTLRHESLLKTIADVD